MKNNKLKICIISIFFGKLPEWINVWVKTASYNSKIDFLFITDQNFSVNKKNFKIINFTFKDFKKLALEKLQFKIKLNTPYKLCDYKEVWGLILEDYIKEYDFWGECDTDVVFGDLCHYFDEYELYKYDKFGCRGHLTLYRNSKDIIERYKMKGSWFGNYKEVFSSNRIWAFDETPGINAIYESNSFPYMDKILFGDIDVNYNDLRLVEFDVECPSNYERQLFVWSNGKLLRKYLKNGEICYDELMYIHLQKRKMKSPTFDVDNIDEFLIINGDFVQLEEPISIKYFDQYNIRDNNQRTKTKFGGKYKKDLRFFWIGRRILNLEFDLKNFIKKTFIYKCLKKGE